eukprot:TRINITY_DN2635_c0_g2_i1.p1 TRINITY_DN2635_c0_g2~~TRINITY_DN2635_c0_g2_i1.p1  ORF type:complete len:409 (-),score=64.63 TRINITY_DN2635_c0_g2_i1:8-1234(-)
MEQTWTAAKKNGGSGRVTTLRISHGISQENIGEDGSFSTEEIYAALDSSDGNNESSSPTNSDLTFPVPTRKLELSGSKDTELKDLMEDDFTSKTEYDSSTDPYVVFEYDAKQKKTLSSGTLNRLIQWLTSPNEHDPLFMAAFFITYRSFTTPQILLDRLICRYEAVPSSLLSESEKLNFLQKKQSVIRLRAFNALKFWVERHEYDLQDEEVKKNFQSFAKSLALLSEQDKKMSNMLLRAIQKAVKRLNLENSKCDYEIQLRVFQAHQEKILKMLKHLEDMRRGARRVATEETGSPEKHAETGDDIYGNPINKPPPLPILPKNYRRPSEYLLDWDPEEIARQLTLIEFEIFRRIQPKEFLNQAWNKNGKMVSARNICELIDRFNWTGSFMSTIIAVSYTHLTLPTTPYV